MPITPPFELYDRLLDGQLAERLRSWRDEGDLSFYEISQRLRDVNVRVTPETVRKWLIELGGHTPARKDGAA